LLAITQTKLVHAIILFSDTSCGLDPLNRGIVCYDKASYVATYSRQIMDLVPNNEIKHLPVPCLPPFLSAFVEGFWSQMIAWLESLRSSWWTEWIWMSNGSRPISAAQTLRQLQLAIVLVSEKLSHCDKFSVNLVICFVADEEEAENLKRIPGSGYQ
jgi:hypothetical protein